MNNQMDNQNKPVSNQIIMQDIQMKKLAIFDFDGTLYPFETFTFLIDQLKKQSGFQSKHSKFNRQFFVTYVLYKLKIIPKHKMRERALTTFIQLFAGMTRNDIYRFFENAYLDMKDRVNADVLRELQELKERGFVIVLVSGAVRPLLEIVNRDIPFDILVGSEIPIKNDAYDEHGEIIYIQGEMKVEGLMNALHNEGITNSEINWEESFAYADSESDLPILELVGHPVCVAPDNKLREIAISRKWEVIN